MESKERKDFDFSEWLAEGVDGMVGSMPKVTPTLPTEFKEHTKTAFREMLLAYRSLVDAVISKTERQPQDEGVKIKVE
jgi:hypothetical protein